MSSIECALDLNVPLNRPPRRTNMKLIECACSNQGNTVCLGFVFCVKCPVFPESVTYSGLFLAGSYFCQNLKNNYRGLNDHPPTQIGAEKKVYNIIHWRNWTDWLPLPCWVPLTGKYEREKIGQIIYRRVRQSLHSSTVTVSSLENGSLHVEFLLMAPGNPGRQGGEGALGSHL